MGVARQKGVEHVLWVWLGTKGWSMWWRGVARNKWWSMWWRGVAMYKGVEHVVERCGQEQRGGACDG